jgi:rfaE bifunctional protein nucleotidyltransferase chain/domain
MKVQQFDESGTPGVKAAAKPIDGRKFLPSSQSFTVRTGDPFSGRYCPRSPMPVPKLKTADELAEIREKMEAEGQRLVLTNGCFDLLHVGHVRYLQLARDLGDALAVALNSDASVRALKGPTRPITAEQDRAEVMAALGCVDFVTIFPSVRVTGVIEGVRPHVYVKGGDYTVETLDPSELAALQAAGTEIRILPLTPGKSTTGILKKLTP